MIKSTSIRKPVIGLGTLLIIVVSLLTSSTFPFSKLLEILIRAFGATMLYVSVALASAIHRSYPAKHDKPEDIGKTIYRRTLLTVSSPILFFTMLTQISIPLALASPIGLLTARTLSEKGHNRIRNVGLYSRDNDKALPKYSETTEEKCCSRY